MGESRGRKANKAWQMQVGIKELIFTGLGMAGLVMMSFALGTLAGRGDIYRVLNNWGLLGPDSGKTGQIWHQAPSPPPATAPVVALASPAPQQEAPPAEKPAPQQHAHSAPKAPPPEPVKGNIVAAPNPVVVQAKKKSPKQEGKPKEDQLEKIRREVASKLKFQNSLDLATTRGASAKKGDDKEPTATLKSANTQVVLVKYRNVAQARAKFAQMLKQGEKVVLREGKDQEGQYYAICRQVAVKPAEPPQRPHAQVKKTKVESKSSKPKPTGQREARR
jgi:hypothetical protein